MQCNEIQRAVKRVLQSRTFAGLLRLQSFLDFVVKETLSGRGQELKEMLIGAIVYGRGVGFDPKCDSIVRVEAVKLRNRLEAYYRTEGARDSIIVSIPKGQYMPVFNYKQFQEKAATAVEELCRESHRLMHTARAEAVRKAQGLLWQAAELSNNCAAVYALLAKSFAIGITAETFCPRTILPQLRMASAEALLLNPERSDTLTAAALVAAFADHDLLAAHEYLSQALKISPQDADAQYWCGALLSSQGMSVESHRHIKEATRLQPSSLLFSTSWALGHYFEGRPRHARTELGEILEMTPEYLSARVFLSLVLCALGRHEEAIEEAHISLEHEPSSPLPLLYLAHAHAKAGHQEKTEHLLEQLEERSHTAYVPNCRLAMIHAALGQFSRVEEDLRKCISCNDASLVFARMDPDLGPLSRSIFHGNA